MTILTATPHCAGQRCAAFRRPPVGYDVEPSPLAVIMERSALASADAVGVVTLGVPAAPYGRRGCERSVMTGRRSAAVHQLRVAAQG